MDNHKEFGNIGEDLAAKYLVKNGFKILCRNYRFGKGEIDIVAKQNDRLVFVEVKTRKNMNFGAPELAVTPTKIKQIKKIANAYLFYYKPEFEDIRFDVIAIQYIKNEPAINHIENAF